MKKKEAKNIAEELIEYLSGVLRRSKEGDKHNPELFMCLELQTKTLKQIQALKNILSQIEELKKGENEFWRKRWQNNDAGKQLFEIRKKWLTTFRCAENWQKMYEELKAKKEL